MFLNVLKIGCAVSISHRYTSYQPEAQIRLVEFAATLAGKKIKKI